MIEEVIYPDYLVELIDLTRGGRSRETWAHERFANRALEMMFYQLEYLGLRRQDSQHMLKPQGCG